MKLFKNFKETKVGATLNKIAPSIVDAVGDAFPPANLLKMFIRQSPEMTTEQKQQIEAMLPEYELELTKMMYADRANARDMYKADSDLQKLWAQVFLYGYISFTAIFIVLVYLLSTRHIDVEGWAVSLISAIWGGMTAKVSTINDFLFGGSKDGQENTKQALDGVKKIGG
jgi:hypothetical protein